MMKFKLEIADTKYLFNLRFIQDTILLIADDIFYRNDRD